MDPSENALMSTFGRPVSISMSMKPSTSLEVEQNTDWLQASNVLGVQTQHQAGSQKGLDAVRDLIGSYGHAICM